MNRLNKTGSPPVVSSTFDCARVTRLSLACVLFTVVSGCGSIQQLAGVTPLQKYNKALERQHYRQAIAIAEQALQQPDGDIQAKDQAIAESQHQQWQQKRDIAIQRAQAYQADEIAAINSLLGQNQWPEIDKKLDFIERHLPEADVINQLEQTVTDRREQYIQQLLQQLLQHEAVVVPKTAELYDQLHEANVSDRHIKRQRRFYLKQKEQLIARLDKQFAEAVSRDDIQGAIGLGRQLEKLSPSETLSERLRSLQATLASKVAEKNQLAASQRAAVRAANEQALLERYNQAIAESRWVDAKDMIVEILKLSPDNEEWLARNESLQLQLNEVVELGRQEGDALYADGDIEAALDIWERTLQLVPDDQKLRANIERAQRILTKIESIKGDQ